MTVCGCCRTRVSEVNPDDIEWDTIQQIAKDIEKHLHMGSSWSEEIAKLETLCRVAVLVCPT